MREHFYTYPIVIELRPERPRPQVPPGTGVHQRSQTPVDLATRVRVLTRTRVVEASTW